MRLLRMVLPVLAGVFISCAGISPYCNVPEPGLFRAVRTIGVAPARISSFDLSESEVSDTSAYPLQEVRDRLSKTFTVVSIDSVITLKGSRTFGEYDGELLVRGKETGVDAIVWPEFKYVSTRYELHVQVHLRFTEVSGGKLIAESGDDGLWGDSWVNYPDLRERLRTTIDAAVRHLEEFLHNKH